MRYGGRGYRKGAGGAGIKAEGSSDEIGEYNKSDKLQCGNSGEVRGTVIVRNALVPPSQVSG